MLEIAGILFILICCGLLIYWYGKVVTLHLRGEDVLKTTIIPGTEIDLWSLSHFVLFAILGYYFPCYIPYLLVFAAAWELVEHLTGDPSWRREYLGLEVKTDFWYAKISDIMVDTFGLLVGYLLIGVL